MSERNLDAVARAARERAELAVLRSDAGMALEACRLMVELFAAGFRLFDLPAASAPAVPKEITAMYDGRCVQCRAPIAAGDRIVWSADEGAARCLRCGARKAA
jgi:hypothetical protein